MDPFADLGVHRKRTQRKKNARRRRKQAQRDATPAERKRTQHASVAGTKAAVALARSNARYFFNAWRREAFPGGVDVYRSRNAVAYDFAWMLFCRRRAREASIAQRTKRSVFRAWVSYTESELRWKMWTLHTTTRIETKPIDDARTDFVLSRTATPRRLQPRAHSASSSTPPLAITADDVGVGHEARRAFLRQHFRHHYGGGGDDGDVNAAPQPTRGQFYAAGKFDDCDLELMSRLIPRSEFL